MRRHGRLIEDNAGAGIDARRDIGRRDLARLRVQQLRVLRLGQRMQIDDTEDAVEILLQLHPVADGAEIVAEMQVTGGLDARKDAVHGAGCSWAERPVLSPGTPPWVNSARAAASGALL